MKRVFFGDEQVPDGYKPNREFHEAKSKRVQILITPSLYDKLKMKSKITGVSVNEIINVAIDRITKAV